MLTLKVNNIDKTSEIEWSTIQKMEVLNKEPDRLEFGLKNYGSKTYRPALSDTVELYDDEVKIFAGVITETKEDSSGVLKYFKVVCKDWSYEMDRKVVNQSYKNQSVNYILNDIITNYLPAGFTMTTVDVPNIINEIKFNDEIPSKCFQRLTELLGDFDWYIDYDKDIYFFKEYEKVAPFELTDTAGNYVFGSLSITRNVNQIRNTIIVKGGQKVSSVLTDTIKSNGSQRTFTLIPSLQSLDIQKSINGGSSWSTLTLGADGTDDPATKDALYNTNNGFLIFPEASKPADGHLVKWSGNQVYPIKLIRKDWTSINKYGEFQYVIKDETIKSEDQAKQRALGELKKYAEKINEGTFRTYKSGLETSQKIHIQSDALGLDEYFKINRIILAAKGPETYEYTVSLIASETMTMIDVLSKLLITNTSESQSVENEVLVQAEGFIEEMKMVDGFIAMTYPRATPTFQESMSAGDTYRVNPFGVNVGPLWVAGSYYPTGPSDRNRSARTDAGNLVRV